jgi:hypothetical protein
MSTTVGGIDQVYDTNGYAPRPLQRWKARIRLDDTSGTFVAPEQVSGVVVAAWIDPATLKAGAVVTVYDDTDDLSTPVLFVNYTVPNPAVETRSALAAMGLVSGTLTCAVTGANVDDDFDLYVWVDASASSIVSATAGTALIGKVGIDQVTANANEVVVKSMPDVTVTSTDVAHDAADSGNPVKIGGKCRIALPTAVAEGDRADMACDPYGRPFTNIDPIVPLLAKGDYTGAQTDTSMVSAPGAGLSIYFYDTIITNDGTAAITVKFEEDVASAKTQITSKYYIPANGGIVINRRVPIKCTANKSFGVTTTGTSNFSIEVGYKVAP